MKINEKFIKSKKEMVSKHNQLRLKGSLEKWWEGMTRGQVHETRAAGKTEAQNEQTLGWFTGNKKG